MMSFAWVCRAVGKSGLQDFPVAGGDGLESSVGYPNGECSPVRSLIWSADHMVPCLVLSNELDNGVTAVQGFLG
jgi:hypothetical protein